MLEWGFRLGVGQFCTGLRQNGLLVITIRLFFLWQDNLLGGQFWAIGRFNLLGGQGNLLGGQMPTQFTCYLPPWNIGCCLLGVPVTSFLLRELLPFFIKTLIEFFSSVLQVTLFFFLFYTWCFHITYVNLTTRFPQFPRITIWWIHCFRDNNWCPSLCYFANDIQINIHNYLHFLE